MDIDNVNNRLPGDRNWTTLWSTETYSFCAVFLRRLFHDAPISFLFYPPITILLSISSAAIIGTLAYFLASTIMNELVGKDEVLIDQRGVSNGAIRYPRMWVAKAGRLQHSGQTDRRAWEVTWTSWNL